MDDIVNERTEWELYGEEEVLGSARRQPAGDGIDWELMEELLAVDRVDPPPPPAYPVVVETDGKLM